MSEKNYKIKIEYDGTRYYGWEHQPDRPTIQGKIERVLGFMLMSKEDIEKAQKDAEMHASEDKKKKEAIDARNQLENTIYQAEKMPTEFKDKISDDDKEAIKKAVAEAKEQLEKSADDKEKLEEATKALNDAIMPIGAKLYQAAADDKKDDKSEDKKDDGTVEGEVVDK